VTVFHFLTAKYTKKIQCSQRIIIIKSPSRWFGKGDISVVVELEVVVEKEENKNESRRDDISVAGRKRRKQKRVP